MSNVLRRTRRTGLALVVALGLTVLAAVATPLVSDELAEMMPGVGVALASDSEGHGG